MADHQATIVNQLDEQEARWFAVYTKFRREKQVLKYLNERGIQAYLPIQSFTRRYTRKIKHVQIPLINCYIFTKITKQEYIPVLETPDVVNFVKFAKDLIAIPDKEMDIMKRVVGEGIEIDVQPGSYQLGDEVEIIGGNLTGLSGWLVEAASEKNFVIELENLGYTLRMSLDPALLRKTGRRASDRSRSNLQGSAGFGWSLL
ncbi:MAG: UpxY family transcription antiterminator [Saprospiraceae bacterium]|nr:UpxY family transcription antiterminator [Saprospiraceae bacterium]